MANYEATVAPLGTYSSGVSWSAVIGGAIVAAAVSLIMLALGAGFEVSAISPWSNAGMSAATVCTTALVWLIVTQVVASSAGGYLTGRWRIRWQSIHNDEVHFRDTAHGLLAWAVSVVLAAAFLAASANALAGNSPTRMETATMEQADAVLASTYLVDRLFRSDRTPDNDTAGRTEASRIIAHNLTAKTDDSADMTYLNRLVAAKTGLNAADASSRVSETMTEARQTADNVRRVTARILLWTFFALLIGAFCASFAATVGGKQRDRVKPL